MKISGFVGSRNKKTPAGFQIFSSYHYVMDLRLIINDQTKLFSQEKVEKTQLQFSIHIYLNYFHIDTFSTFKCLINSIKLQLNPPIMKNNHNIFVIMTCSVFSIDSCWSLSCMFLRDEKGEGSLLANWHIPLSESSGNVSSMYISSSRTDVVLSQNFSVIVGLLNPSSPPSPLTWAKC